MIPAPPPVKFVFLDIDGVLNHPGVWTNRRAMINADPAVAMAFPSDEDQWNVVAIDRTMTCRLNRLREATGARFILSSSWRLGTPLPKVNRYLRYRGFTSTLMGSTPELSPAKRGEEIDAWLMCMGLGYNISFVVLDDDDDMSPHMSRLVQTDGSVGLTDSDVNKAIELLRGLH